MKLELHRPIETVVLEQIFPRATVEIKPDDLHRWLGDYGHIRHPETGECFQLRGVRLPAHRDIVSYANWYTWSKGGAGKWRSWNIYIGASGAPGLRISR